jgi:3-oxoacyl-[acyl-carrier protein] reductase
MENKRFALVTGVGKGMGREIALAMADTVSGIAVHYHRQREAAESVAAEIERKGKLSAVFRADLTKENQAEGLIKRVEGRFGRLDILVNTIGPILVKPWIELEAADWESMLKGNLESAFFCLKAALPGMRVRKWGRIINIGYHRVEQLGAFPNITPYAVAKTGLLILTRTAASAETALGITVNMVSPGLIEGGVLPQSRKSPKNSLGTYKDVAEAVLFLASDKAQAITGTNLIVAGSWKM